MTAARINRLRPGLYRSRKLAARDPDKAARVDVEAGSPRRSPLRRHVDVLHQAIGFCAVNPVADRLPGGLFIRGWASNG
ncbi:hypothetical protein [Georhizobium profundi]|uniref:hypothetical protein n=1 Tax=Georhizobium profundi TaxID=2341112 RepID=UPI0013E0A718|nr:hypothetical protein [Georhizobium profundi]